MSMPPLIAGLPMWDMRMRGCAPAPTAQPMILSSLEGRGVVATGAWIDTTRSWRLLAPARSLRYLLRSFGTKNEFLSLMFVCTLGCEGHSEALEGLDPSAHRARRGATEHGSHNKRVDVLRIADTGLRSEEL